MTLVNIVAVPFHDWKKSQKEGFRTRDVHLLQEFSQHPSVDKLLILDRPISISEMVILRRPIRVHDGKLINRSGFSWLSKLGEKTYVLDTFIPQIFRPVIQHRKWLPYIYGQRSFQQSVSHAIRYLDLKKFVLFLSSPLPYPLHEQLGSPMLVLDAIDNLTKHTGFSSMREELEQYYQGIIQKAEIIFTNSQETSDWLSKGRQRAIYIPNGVNPDSFYNSHTEIPEDLKPLSTPIVGYAGKMQEMFDVELLRKVALNFPEISFVFIGQILNSSWMKPIWKFPNVHYLGDKHYRDLSSYLAYFDICIIPYSIEKQHGGDPIKFYEYLASNKPVVTTDIGGVAEFSGFPQVKVVSNGDEFVSALAEILSYIRDGNKFAPIKLPEKVLWSYKADWMINSIALKYTED